MWVADRVRWALHYKCNDRVKKGHEFKHMRVEDAGGPGMCFKCCSYGHRADQCIPNYIILIFISFVFLT